MKGQANASFQHIRHESMSSLGSFMSDDFREDPMLDFDLNLLPPAAKPLSPPASPSRARANNDVQRLGAEMSIIATTSPEIKALNLPITPSFPEGMQSFSEVTPNSSCLLPRASEFDMSMHSTVGTQTPKRNYAARCDRIENTHPNKIVSRQVSAPTSRVEKESADIRSLRKSFHRRASFASLPSPAEISGKPSFGADSFDLGVSIHVLSPDTPKKGASPRWALPNRRMVAPKRLHLGAAFR